MNFDVIIIGGGPAGLSAAMWCDDLDLSALLLESEAEFGGQLLRTHNAIENHLGTEAKNGRELRDIFIRQIADRNFSARMEAEIIELDLKNKTIFLKSGEQFSARALIIATGVRRRRLEIPGEKEFRSKGILESGKRDKNSVKDKSVVIVGGGDAALENSLILAETAAKVTVVHRRNDFRARPEFIEPAKVNPKIEFLTETVLNKITGSEQIEAVELQHLTSGKRSFLPTDAVLIRIGVEPNTKLVREQLDTDKNGYIQINHLCETSFENIWAIGDVANPNAPTVSSAIGMGATAVKNIAALLNC